METFSLSPKENMVEKIAEYLISRNKDNSDYSRITIIFPNKRPKHFLLKYMKDKIGKSFFPPHVLSMDEFIEQAFEKIFPEFKNLSVIESVYVIYELFQKFRDFIEEFEQKNLFSDFEKFYPFGIRIFEAFEELYIENVSAQKLKEYESLINFYSSLSKIYNEFYLMLEKEKLATRAFKYRKVAEKLKFDILPKVDLFLLCGFFGLTKAEQKTIENIKNIFEKEQTSGCFCLWIYDNSLSEENKPLIKIYECPDRHGQVYTISNILERKSINEETVVVMPSEDLLFPILKQGLSFLEEEEYNISMGYPVIRTPIWSFFEALSKMLNSLIHEEKGKYLFPVSEYLQFVLHPYVKNIMLEDDPTVTRILFHSLESYLSEEGITVILDELEDNILDKVFNKIDGLKKYELTHLKKHIKKIHDTLIRPFFNISNVRDFSEKCIRLLNFIYSKSTAKYHTLFFPFYNTMVNKIEELANSLLKNINFPDFSGYFNLLKNYIRNIRTPFEGIPIKGLQILGFLETRNLNFKNVFFLDLNEEIFPPIYEDYVLPLKVREALGLPTFKDREKLIEYYFRTLINGAEQVHLFYVRDEKREKSRFIEKLIWEIEKKSQKINKQIVHYRVNLSADKPKEIKKEKKHIDFLKNLSYSPSSIDMYLKCPLKFYYSYFLGLKDKEETEIDSAQVGRIVHSVLASFFEGLKNIKKLNNHHLKIDLIKKITDEEFKKRYGDYISGSLYLIKEQIIKRVIEVLEKYYSNIISNYSLKILGVEEPLNTIFEEIKISGRIDIIEERSEKIFLIDYKTSGKKDNYRIKIDKLPEILDFYKSELRAGKTCYLTHLLSKSILSLQIPIYLLGFSREKNIPLNNLVGIYLLIGKSKIDNDIEFNPLEKSLSLENAMDIMQSILKSIINELVNLDIPFYPTKNFKENCQYCDFRTICGTLWIKSRE